ncbi:protein of unknown function [Xenorhabdus poinarii G6]|uniref:Uncharacterized protein n=1 Tax=Xenorhabdus poinarii G6 TaxID=1354304 RepID=A0A068R442_9GAMM|nr:protein of unknown function [Xenorhabdus poinarii G6]
MLSFLISEFAGHKHHFNTLLKLAMETLKSGMQLAEMAKGFANLAVTDVNQPSFIFSC